MEFRETGLVMVLGALIASQETSMVLAQDSTEDDGGADPTPPPDDDDETEDITVPEPETSTSSSSSSESSSSSSSEDEDEESSTSSSSTSEDEDDDDSSSTSTSDNDSSDDSSTSDSSTSESDSSDADESSSDSSVGRPTREGGSVEQSVSTDGDSVVIVVNGETTSEVPRTAASDVLSSISQSAANNNGSGDDNNAASGSNVKAWAIPVGIVGGLILFGLIGYIAFRLCKKRDDADEEPIRWPEIQAGDGDSGVLMPTGATRQGGHGIDFDSEEDGGGRDTQAMRNVPAGVGATGVMGGPSMRSGYTDTSSQPYSDPSSYHNSHQQHYYDQGAAAYQSGYPTAEHPYASAAPPAAGLAYNPGGASNGQLAMPDYGGVQERHGAIGQTNDWLSPAPSHPVGGNGAPTATSNSVSTPSTNIPSPSSEQISSGPSDLERSGTVLSQHEPSRPLGVANA